MTDEEFWQHAHIEAAKAATILSPSDSAALPQYLECGLQRGTCFVPLHAIEAVISASSPFARLPFAPRWLHGVLAWRSEIVAVVNLDNYLSNTDTPVDRGTILIARHPECIIGLRVPEVGSTITIEFEQLAPVISPSTLYTPERVDIIKGLYGGYPVLDIVRLLSDMTLQIEMAAHHA